MPVVKRPADLPPWCELKHFDIVRLTDGETKLLELPPGRGRKTKLLIGEGACELAIRSESGEAETRSARAGDQFDLAGVGSAFGVTAAPGGATAIWLCGDWGEEVGGAGVFELRASDAPGNDGDPADYPRNTFNDNHYHDCDEYYVLFGGAGTVATEGRLYAVEAGDCVITGKGHHHDIPVVLEPIRAIFFETTLQGLKRRGHLWNHTHGPAEPDPSRI